MNELELVSELDDGIALPEVSELSFARETLLEGIASVQQRRRQRRRRLGLACAALTAAAAVLILASRPPRHLPPPASADLTATQVLERAAFVVLHIAAPRPRGDQFIYTDVRSIGGGVAVTRSWLSVDGMHDSLVAGHAIHGCAPGRSCNPTRAYFPNMPTRASQMLGFLERTQGVRPNNLNDLAKTVGWMLDFDYVLPGQQAALFEFLARTRGITLVPNVDDAAGRPGIGVSWWFGGSRSMLIFDPNSYRYLGITTDGEGGQVGGEALLQIAIVNRVGQLPGSSQPPSA
jgi:hypothetical protein